MENILVVDDISKAYPGRKAVSNVSFQVQKGSIHGFLGPNGAGKSTTMKMIAGLIPATSGEIKLFGKSIKEDEKNYKNSIGLLPENPPLYFDMTVENYLDFIARIHEVKNVKERVNSIIEGLSLVQVRKRLIGNLSKGFKQRVGLAQALVYDAPFIMLDEPTNGLDPEAVVEFRNYIKELAKNKTILFSSHILSEVEQICDRVTIIHEGKIRATGTIEEIHRKFSQGLVLKIGIGKGEILPDLRTLGHYEIVHQVTLNNEDQFQICFKEERDCRSEISKILVSAGIQLKTLQVEIPELEDIFLHLTERV